MQINEDYNYCRQIIKSHSKSFYYGFSQLPEDEAKAVYAIYAFCRTADDIVDGNESEAEKREALQLLLQQIDSFEHGEQIDHPMWRALADVRNKFPLDLAMFRKQVTGQMMDLDFRQPATIEDLYHYSSHVAGSVGELLYPILAGQDTQAGRKAADNLGIAMQITNILRDIGEDHREKQRIYIPKSMMQTYQYTEQNLINQEINEAFIVMWEALAQDAEDRYNRFYPHLIDYNRESRQPLLVAALIYAEILNEVRRNNYNCLTRRNKVSLISKKKISTIALQILKEEHT